MTEATPPRRIAPQTGPHLWSGAALSPADWMLPLGSEIRAEIEAAPGLPLPRLDPLLGQMAERLAHGPGFCLLRGLPLPEEPAAVLGRLGSRIGRPVHTPPSVGPVYTEPCDALLLLCREAGELMLHSAAALHNQLLRSDRAALEVLYRALPTGAGEALPVFAVTQGVFAARCDRTALDPGALAALEALDEVAAAPGLALRMVLHPGDLLCVNPFLVWASCARGLATLALLTEPSRLSEGPFAALRPAER
ncbi:hypothetical protein QMO56_09730 [Roseomonas sp. E05]|uniref:hypothetical protein n=1 Tax=Roseomonas sp. E05 TaxID=3046310 RepID=UPI0024BBCBBD|nr:hypothetical protein [Roseomonas sp. E05]MDJ0388393.1 hypothetical protein [Roseomonas sp. E05]